MKKIIEYRVGDDEQDAVEAALADLRDDAAEIGRAHV